MADPLFDPTQAHKSLQSAFERKQRSGRRLTDVLQNTQEDVSNINRDYAADLNRFGTQTERINEAAMEALDRLEAIDSNPVIVNRIMSLFDSNYSRTAQERKLQRAQWETNRLANQLKIKEDLRTVKLQEAGQELQLAEQLYRFDQQGFLDQAQLMEMGFRVEAAIDKRTLDLAKNASIEDLNKWRQDPSKAPAALKGKPGLIDTVYFERRLSELGVADAEKLAEVRDFEIASLRQTRALAELDDKSLQKALSTGKLPEGVSVGAAQDEWERRQQVDYALRTAANAAALGDIELEITSKNFALSKMTTDQIDTLRQIANQSRDGTAAAGGLKFTIQELKDAYDAAYNRDVERQRARNEVIMGMAGIRGQLEQAEASIDTLAALTNPGGVYTENSLDSLPPTLRARVKSLQDQITTAADLPNGGMQAAKKIAELQTLLDDFAKDQIASKPKEQQPAFQEYYDTGGLINNPEAAANYLVQALPNPATMAHDLVYGPIWEEFSNHYLELAGQKTQEISVNETGIVIGKTDKPNNVDVLEKAAKNVRSNAVGVLFQSYAAESILRMQERLQAQMGHPDGTINIWEGIVNPNTLAFDESVYEISRDPSTGEVVKTFDLGRLSQFLAAKTSVLRQQGVLKPGESLNQILENTLRSNTALYAATVSAGSIEKAALTNILFGNNTAYYLGEAVRDFGNYTDTALQVAQERAHELEEQVNRVVRDPRPGAPGQRARELQTGGPAVGPRINRTSGLQENPGDQLLIEMIRGGMGVR